MTGGSLFRSRLLEEWTYKWRVVRTVLDWTIWVYVVTPGIIIGSFLYADALKDIDHYWNHQIPFALLLVGLLLISSSGNIRTFLMEADLLFIIQRKRLLYRLKQSSLYYSLFTSIIGPGLVILLSMPILTFIYHFSSTDIIALSVGVVAYKWGMLVIKREIHQTFYKWIVYPAVFLIACWLILALPPTLYGTAGALIIIAIIITQHMQLPATNHFLKDVEIEQFERTKLIRLILNFSMEVEKPPRSQKKKPLILFPGSVRLFSKRTPENGLLEVLLKSFIRNPSNRSTYYQLTMFTGMAIILLPIWLKWVIYFGFVLFLGVWLNSLFKKMVEHDFFTVIPFDDEELPLEVWVRFKKWITLPGAVFTGILAVVSSLVG